MHQIAVVATEDGGAHTGSRRQTVGGAVAVGHEHLSAGGSRGVRLIIDITRLLIVAVDSGYLVVAVGQLAHLSTAHIVEIEMLITAALAGQQDGLVADAYLSEHLLLHVFLSLLLDHQSAVGSHGVHEVEAQTVLVAVHRDDSHPFGRTRREHAGDVAVGIEGHGERARLTRREVDALHRNLRVVAARHRILIRVVAGIFAILLALGGQSLEQLHGVLLHGALVVAYPHQVPTVGSEHHRAVGRELLLIHPVGDAVDHLVATAVVGHLLLLTVFVQVDHEDIILADEGHLAAVGREDGHLLRPTLTEGHQGLILQGIEIVVGCRRTAIDGLRLRLYQHPPPVGTHRIAVDMDVGILHLGGVEEHTGELARLKRVAHHLPTIAADLGVVLAIGQRTHLRQACGGKLTAGDVLQTKTLTGIQLEGHHRQATQQ